MSPAQYWFVAAIVLFILEVITPGFVLANIGVAALAAGLAAVLDASFAIQIVVFVLTGLLSFVTLRPVMHRLIGKNQARAATGVAALPGATGVVTEAIPAGITGGRVRIQGDDWHAVTTGGPIAVGETVVVERVDSTTLIVARR